MTNLMLKTHITKLTENSVTLFKFNFVFKTVRNNFNSYRVHTELNRKRFHERFEMFQTVYLVETYILLFFCIKHALLFNFLSLHT